MNDELNKKITTLCVNMGQVKTTVENLHNNFEEWKRENKEDHEEMKNGIKHTNGDVSNLKLWRSGLTGAFSVFVLLSGGFLFLINTIIDKKVDERIETSLNDYQLKVIEPYENK